MMNFKEKLLFQKALHKNIITKKEFAYTKDGVNLNFTLNIDDSKELKNFRECLEEAIKDIHENIKKINVQ